MPTEEEKEGLKTAKKMEAATKALLNSEYQDEDLRYGLSKDTPFNWREALQEPYQEKDVRAMNSAALPDVQLQMTRLAFSKDQKISLSACQFLLAQGGHGAVQKVEHSIEYAKLPVDQLAALVQSKLQSIQKLNPDFDVQKLLAGPIQSQIIDIEAEGEEIE